MGRDPNPSIAYGDTIRAVEAAAKPVIYLDDNVATLGKMIRAMSDADAAFHVGLTLVRIFAGGMVVRRAQ